MLYKITLDENGYLLDYSFSGTEEDIYEIPSSFNSEFMNCYKPVDGVLIFDEEKKEMLIRQREAEEKHEADINEQTLKMAQMFVTMGVNADDFLDRIDAQTLYTALMTDTLIESEETLDE